MDVRIVAATNRDLKGLVRNGVFREDLTHRLNVIPIHIPPLRERREDIPPLALHILEHSNRNMGSASDWSRSPRQDDGIHLSRKRP